MTHRATELIRWAIPDVKTAVGWVVALIILIWSISADRSSALQQIKSNGEQIALINGQVTEHAKQIKDVEKASTSVRDHEDRIRKVEEALTRMVNDVQWIRYTIEHGGTQRRGSP